MVDISLWQLWSLALRLLGLHIMVIGVLPKVLAETKVRDGIKKLRILIFWGFLMCFAEAAALFYLRFCMVFDCVSNGLNVRLSFLEALFFLNISVVWYLIYHEKYKH